ncbi:kinesin-like protein Nod [Chrysoperla carnea]|uniref:kinesin-like protein Nod n=1 Tax=Chrysoperla carnea TaxID=189513 RepID=UPI001D07BF66|nr:kinesin-like protein Nod [Chrysoperla carnea]
MEIKHDVCPLKVSVRIRPGNCEAENVVALNEEDDTAIAIGDKAFIFDKIFDCNATQERIYNETVKPFVQKVLTGYSCTCLAYGQTGTGKTYTMLGKNKTANYEQNAGLISRALDDIFNSINEDIENRQMKVEVAFIEIYNNKIFDLLRPCKDNQWVFKNSKIEPSVFQEVRMVFEAQELLTFGVRHRHTGETKMNAKSSRSHTIFTIKCTIENNLTSQISKLNLVDLGGSESIKRTGNEGIARSEGISINQSLLALRQVLIALSRNDRVIPFRESVLTTVLYDSLTIKNFIILIACISPQANDYFETISTLRFAESTKEIKSKPEIDLVFNKLKAKNPTVIEKCNVILSVVGINPTPSKILKLNNTISTPGHRNKFKIPRTALKVNNTYSPMHSTAIHTPMDNSKLIFMDLVKKGPDINPQDFEVDEANLSSSTVLEELQTHPPKNDSYSPIVQKCTKVIEDKLSHIVSDQLNTIMRRKSKRLALMQDMSPYKRTPDNEPEKTPFGRSFLMNNFEDTIKRMVEEQVKQMTEKTLNKYFKKDSISARKLFSDDSNENYTANSENSNSEYVRTLPLTDDSNSVEYSMISQTSSNSQNDHVFKVPTITKPLKSQRKNAPRRSKRLSVLYIEEKENIIEDNDGAGCSGTQRRRSKRISMSIDKENSKSRCSKKRILKTPQRYSPIISTTVKRHQSKRKSLAPSIIKHKEKVLETLNNGSARDITKLSMIGPKTSEQIVTYRSLHGHFKELKDVKNMKFWSDKQWNKFLQSNCCLI